MYVLEISAVCVCVCVCVCGVRARARVDAYLISYTTYYECSTATVVTIKSFRKAGYDFTARNNVTDILYNTYAITSIAKLIVRSLVGSKNTT